MQPLRVLKLRKGFRWREVGQELCGGYSGGNTGGNNEGHSGAHDGGHGGGHEEEHGIGHGGEGPDSISAVSKSSRSSTDR